MKCDLCQRERTAKEWSARLSLCALCARWKDSEKALIDERGFHPTHSTVSYYNASRDGFFLQWTDEIRLNDDEVEDLLHRFFRGLHVTIKRVAYPGGRQGFDVTLEDFPLVKNYDCGEDPEKVPPSKQKIFVSNHPEFFHAETSGRCTAEALAVGLNVFVRSCVSR